MPGSCLKLQVFSSTFLLKFFGTTRLVILTKSSHPHNSVAREASMAFGPCGAPATFSSVDGSLAFRVCGGKEDSAAQQANQLPKRTFAPRLSHPYPSTQKQGTDCFVMLETPVCRVEVFPSFFAGETRRHGLGGGTDAVRCSDFHHFCVTIRGLSRSQRCCTTRTQECSSLNAPPHNIRGTLG